MGRALVAFGRALARHCPACGGGSLFRGYYDLRPECPRCGLHLEREEGYWLGAMLLNLLISEGLFIVGLVYALLRTWPTPPWTALTWGSAAAVGVIPIVFYPFAKTLWLALDILVHPPEAGEHAARPPGG